MKKRSLLLVIIIIICVSFFVGYYYSDTKLSVSYDEKNIIFSSKSQFDLEFYYKIHLQNGDTYSSKETHKEPIPIKANETVTCNIEDLNLYTTDNISISVISFPLGFYKLCNVVDKICLYGGLIFAILLLITLVRLIFS